MQGPEARKPYIMIVKALFWIEMRMQETDQHSISISTVFSPALICSRVPGELHLSFIL